MVSSVLRIMSQVEHTRNAIVLTVKASLWTKCRSSESFNSVFLHVTLVLPHGKRTFLVWTVLWCQAPTDQVCVIVSIDWRTPATMHILLVFYKQTLPKYEFYCRKGHRKSNAICVMAIASSTLWWPLYPLFSYCSTLYRLEVMFQSCKNLSYILIYTYFYCQSFKAK